MLERNLEGTGNAQDTIETPRRHGDPPCDSANTSVGCRGTRARSSRSRDAARHAQAGPGRVEVDERAAERALERTLITTGALLLQVGRAEIQPAFAYVRSERDSPVLVTLGTDGLIAAESVRRDTLEADVLLRIGLPWAAQLELGVPYRSVDEQRAIEADGSPVMETSDRSSGADDIRIGVAKTLLLERDWRPELIGRPTWDTDTGNSQGILNGLGFHELEASLTAAKRQDPLVFIGGVSYTATFENDDIDPCDEIGVAIGTVLAASPETSVRPVLDRAFVDDTKLDGAAVRGSDQVVGSLIIGASPIIGPGRFLDVATPIGLTDEAPDYADSVSLAVRFDVSNPALAQLR
ncbi:MAG: hypothetical protein GWO16_03680 [Gammaproteobacteria bacterium]|nr:hypothetical protein [Gammaproteobacteria bacterium]NIR97184.1 hypothetical protein [Gammaproteobacteria bacterium]NIT62901.1 hypothetical protein [Gammaproteobacteria bacterium]NIV19866.1 hypothetical protein [Gammaproteobacteria bacterium]NIY31481.1 hypothetical protein [Gammaproteobacteria bacterium]